MSLDLLRQQRRVKIVNTTRTTTDARGNQITEEAAPVEVWATRQQLSADENTSDRDQQLRTFRYFFEAGTVIDGRSRLLDGDDKLKIIGEPERAWTQLGEHHVEAVAELVEG